jgi:hypothetical protein
MPGRIELIFGYIHCRGETVYQAGYTDTEEEAAAWVKSMREGTAPRPLVPDTELIRTCDACFCPMKSQKPWFSYRAVPSDQA